MSGHLQLETQPLASIAEARGWSEQQINNAKRIIDGGLGQNYGFKEYEETTFGEGDERSEGYGWVYHLYLERIEDLEGVI